MESFEQISALIFEYETEHKKAKRSGNREMTNAHKTLPYPIHTMDTLGGFAQFLTYKVEKVGKRVIRIGEYHIYQQWCMCGKRMKRVLSKRSMTCGCGNRIGQHLNSLINVLKFFVNQRHYFDFLSHQPSMTEESFRKRRDLLRKTVPSPQAVVDGELVVNGRVEYKIIPYNSICSSNG